MSDQTQWLPRNAPVVNSFRMQHGDLDGRIENGKINSAWSSSKTVIDWMVDSGFLEMHHKAYAMTLMDLRLAYDAKHGITWTKVEGGAGVLTAGEAAELYYAICLALGRHSVGAIEWVVTHEASKYRAVCNSDYASALRKEHDKLVKVIDEEWDKRKKALD